MLLKEILGLMNGWKNYNNEEMYLNILKLKRADIPYLILTTIFSIVFIGLVSSNTISFSPIESYSVEDLPDLLSRIGFVWKHYSSAFYLVLSCGVGFLVASFLIAITIRLCGLGKRGRLPIDPWQYYENWILNTDEILLSSIQQFLTSFALQLHLVIYIDAELTLKYVPAIHFLYNLGRTTIWLGPRLYWNLGFTLTLAPTFITSTYVGFIHINAKQGN